ncbi:hypothetical protein CP971_00580 [Streptomyces viridifaciens]|nr:hypothetical protein CP971_00580 [Streptomyces viridifaciens]
MLDSPFGMRLIKTGSLGEYALCLLWGLRAAGLVRGWEAGDVCGAGRVRRCRLAGGWRGCREVGEGRGEGVGGGGEEGAGGGADV